MGGPFGGSPIDGYCLTWLVGAEDDLDDEVAVGDVTARQETLVRLVQSANAKPPILVTELPMVTLVRPLKFQYLQVALFQLLAR